MLKQHCEVIDIGVDGPAAFGRLCVETGLTRLASTPKSPAAFGRLCVETGNCFSRLNNHNPAAFGRLCVETAIEYSYDDSGETSRLRAAVC